MVIIQKTKKLQSSLLLMLFITTLFASFIRIAPPIGAVEGDSTPVGYEFLEDHKYLRIWNRYDSYYFNVSSGVQFSNYYLEWWSKNVLGIGYYQGEERHSLYWKDPTYWGNQWALSGPGYTEHTLNGVNDTLSLRFTAQYSKTVDKLRFYVYSVIGVSPWFRVGLQADSSGEPSGSFLGYADYNATLQGTGWVWQDISDVAVTSGTVYHIVIECLNGTIDASNHLNLRTGTTTQYLEYPQVDQDSSATTDTNFEVLWSTDGGSSWTDQDHTPAFEIEHTDSTKYGQPVRANLYSSVKEDDYHGSEFASAQNRTFTAIDLWMYEQGSAGTLYFVVWDNTLGSAVLNETWTEDISGSPVAWQTHTFGSSLNIDSSHTYQWFLQSFTSNSSNCYWLLGTTTDKTVGHGAYSWGGDSLEKTYTTSGQVPPSAYSDDRQFRFTEAPSNNAPTNDALSRSNLDDTDNMYAQLRNYEWTVETSDVDSDQLTITFMINREGTPLAVATYTESTGTFAQSSGDTLYELITESCSASGSAGNRDVTFAWRVKWAATEESDVDITISTTDGTDTDEDTYSDQFDTVVTLTIMEFNILNSYVNPSATDYASGTVYYIDDPSSTSASTSYPPDVEFTEVQIHNSTHGLLGSDTSIVDGIFNASITTPSTVGTYTAHPYIDMADTDYTDGDITGVNETITVEQVQVQSYTVADARVDVGTSVNVDVILQYASDSSVVTDGTVTINSVSATHQGNGVWRATVTKSSVTGVTYNNVTVSGNVRGITSVDQNSKSQAVVWDRVNIIINVADYRINIGDTAILFWTGTYEYDGSTFTGSITYNDTTSKTFVGEYGYKVASISDPTYTLTAFTTNEVSVIFDKVNITLTALDDTIEVGGTATITKTAIYLYDGTNFDGTITLNDTLTKSSVGTYDYITVNISGDTYNITAFESNTITINFVDTTDPFADAGPDQTVDEDTPMAFDGSNSTDNIGLVSYTWFFTDITTQTLMGVNPTYTFETPGVYTVSLNVTDVGGNWDTDEVNITILDVTDPLADAGSDQTVKVNAEVGFDAGGSSDNVGIVSYEWDFGDETTGTGVTTTHTYTKAGTYTVTLNVVDATGNSDTDTVMINVEEAPGFPLMMVGIGIVTIIIVAIVYLLVIRKPS